MTSDGEAHDGALETLDTVWRDQWGRLTALLVAQYRRLDLVRLLPDGYTIEVRPAIHIEGYDE